MFSNFSEEARKVLVNAKALMKELKHPYVGSEHLMLAILKEDNQVSKRLKTLGLDYQKFKDEVINVIGIGKEESNWFLYTPLLNRVLENACLDAKEEGVKEITIEHLFSSLLEEGEGVAIRIMLGLNIDIDELYDEFIYKIAQPKKKKDKKLLIDELGIDLNQKARDNKIDPVIGREDEIKRLLEILSRRTKNNPILIGDAGVGKTAIVEELSRRIVNKQVPLSLKNKRIVSLDMASSVAGTKYRGEFEERIKKILSEIEENDDIILFIDEIHTLVGAGGAEGAIDASNIFKPSLARGKLRCIGATTIDEYKKYIEKDAALDRRFQKIIVEAPDKKTVKDILMKLKPIYEKYHFVKIKEEIIDLIIELSNKYIYDRKEPDKSIDIMDEVCAKVSLKEDKNTKKYNELLNSLEDTIKRKNEAIMSSDYTLAYKIKEEENNIQNEMNNLELKISRENVLEVTKEDVGEVISIKTKIPIYEIVNNNVKYLDTMKNELENKIVGQNNAIKELYKITKKIKLGLKDNKCYSMLFAGPSGVGKTALAKLISKYLVGEKNIIKLDMSEYSEAHTVSKILGAPPGYVGYSETNTILEQVRNKPSSVLILDEIEKANSKVINLFLQILEDGKILDSNSKEIRFDNVIIIMTSNIGFNEINIGFNKENSQFTNKLKEYFEVPFINRIDNIIVFNSLNKENITKIINNSIDNLKEKYKQKNINIEISESVINEIIKLSEYEQFGARKIEKIIKDKLENIVIDKILEEEKNIKIETISDIAYNK